MRRFRTAMLVLFTSIIIALLFFGVQLKVPAALAYPGGAGTFNSAMPMGNVCTPCHSGTTPAGGSVVINFPVGTTGYTPGGSAIPMSVTVNDPTLKEWGFQLSAVMASNPASTAGTFTAGSNNNVNSMGSVQGSSSSSNNFAFTWAPPAKGTTDSVRFYVTGIALPGSASNNSFYSAMSPLAPVVATATAPTITTQPVSQTVTAGQMATFSVAATGTAPFTYQWMKGTGAITNATQSSYTTPATTTTDSGSMFSVVVKNSAGSATSTAAMLTVNAPPATPPTISSQPVSQTVTAGQAATFSVAATGTAPFMYQWMKGTAAITNATSSSYTTPATTTTDSGSMFSVVVKNSAGSATSTAAMLTVNAASTAAALAVSPSSLTYSYQSSASTSGTQYLKVSSTSTSSLSYSVSISGGPWLTVSPMSGGTPGTITASVNASNMSQGTYSGMIMVSASGVKSITVPVTLNVTSGTCMYNCGGSTTMYAQPYTYDPTYSGTVAALWVDHLGVPTANYSSTGNPGLVLSKNASPNTTAPTTGSYTGAYIRNVSGSLTELGYDYREGGQCSATSPHFVVVASVSGTHTLGGCSTGTSTAGPVKGWIRVRFDMSPMAQAKLGFVPGDTVSSLKLVLDYGPESGATAAGGMVVIDNIDVNGKFVGKQSYSWRDD